MAGLFGGGDSSSSSTTTNKNVTAQDSYVASDGSLLAENAWIVSGDGSLNITDGGAFKLVENVVKMGADLIGGLYSKTVSSLSDSTADILAANQVQNQATALTSQQNSNSLIKFSIGAAAVVAAIYIYKKAE